MIRLAIRGYVRGIRQFEERVECDETASGIETLAEAHARRLLALPGGDKHMIEIEFLDEPDPLERFFRIGTDPSGMVRPVGVRIDGE